MAGESSDSALGARGEQPREPGAFCVRAGSPVHIAIGVFWFGFFCGVAYLNLVVLP